MKIIFKHRCYLSEEKYGRNIVKQVLEPVNTTRKGRASIHAKRVLLAPAEYLQALYLRNSSFWSIFLHSGTPSKKAGEFCLPIYPSFRFSIYPQNIPLTNVSASIPAATAAPILIVNSLSSASCCLAWVLGYFR